MLTTATAKRQTTDEQTGSKSLELEVNNFGPIVRAKIDLRPLTVFIGPSNTGKSYLAILIYALHRFFRNSIYSTGRRFRRGFRLPLDREEIENISDSDVDELFRAIHSISEVSPDKNSIILPPLIADKLRSGFDKQADILSREIARCFGVDEVDMLVRMGKASESRIIIRQSIDGSPNPEGHVISLSQNPAFETVIPEKMAIPTESASGNRRWQRVLDLIRYSKRTDRDMSYHKMDIHDILSTLTNTLLPSLFGPLHLPAYYLPADRTGIMHAHNVVVNALIARASVAGIRPAANTPMLSGVLADFLEQLIETALISNSRRKGTRLLHMVSSIEEKILGGSVHVRRSGPINYPHFTYQPRGWKRELALANASSMVSEIAPIVLYLRDVVQSGDILMVEEPEAHLHPAMQVEFIRELARIVKSGVRVIIITHSEFLLEELSNIVCRSQIPKEERKDSGNDDASLNPEQVGVWRFKPKNQPKKGTFVEEALPDESALYPSGFDTVSYSIYNDWTDIERRSRNGSQ